MNWEVNLVEYQPAFYKKNSKNVKYQTLFQVVSVLLAYVSICLPVCVQVCVYQVKK